MQFINEIAEDFNVEIKDIFNEFEYKVFEEMDIVKKLKFIQEKLIENWKLQTLNHDQHMLKIRYDYFLIRFIMLEYDKVSMEEKIEITNLMTEEEGIKYGVLLRLGKQAFPIEKE